MKESGAIQPQSMSYVTTSQGLQVALESVDIKEGSSLKLERDHGTDLKAFWPPDLREDSPIVSWF